MELIDFSINEWLFTVIGSVIEDSVWQNNRYYVKEYVESYIQVEGKRLKTLITPNVIRTNEPNEVLVELFQGNFHKNEKN